VIEELHIRGLGVIEEASLRLSSGLTVVTGETGAGKTMLVTAVQLLLGSRADVTLVRRGAVAAVVEAVVSPVPAGARDWTDDGDESLTVSREIPAEGRSRARLGGRLAPVSALEGALGDEVEVHAQHEHVRLARPEVQRSLLDRFAGEAHLATLDAYRDEHRVWRDLAARLSDQQAGADERAREIARLTDEVEEISAAGLDPSDDELDVRIELAANSEELGRLVGEAAEHLGSGGAGDGLGRAVAALRRLPVEDADLVALRERVEALALELGDAALSAARLATDRGEGDADLDGLQARKRVVRTLMRKYGASVADVLDHGRRSAERLDHLRTLDDEGDDLADRVDRARETVLERGVAVSDGRREAGDRLGRTVDEHLADLGMPHARFTVAVEPRRDREPSADGLDVVTFLLAPNPGEDARPLATAASGGERSRVSLAIEVALADVDDASVLVFDEVDAGVGGSTALAVGEKLARLAHSTVRPRQVLCVTHLAQLAAFADVHHVVEKGVVEGRTVTTARRVADDDRVTEISRMLGGSITASAGLEHARELLEVARTRGAG